MNRKQGTCDHCAGSTRTVYRWAGWWYCLACAPALLRAVLRPTSAHTESKQHTTQEA